MSVVYVFAFCSDQIGNLSIDEYLNPTYGDDGVMIDSQFMKDVGLTDYEPMAIESVTGKESRPIEDLVAEFSYASQWGTAIPKTSVNTVICVFSPNVISSPRGTTLDYVGCFNFRE